MKCRLLWSVIAVEFPGRSCIEIKDYWNTLLKKLVQNDQTMLENIGVGTLEFDHDNTKKIQWI